MKVNGSFAYYRSSYFDLKPPYTKDLQGDYRATFLGPWWLRLTAGPSIALGGLPGWWGKRFQGEQVTNLLSTKNGFREKFQMQASIQASFLDGRPCLRLTYAKSSGFPWNFIYDEFRVHEQGLLGMTVVNFPLLRKIGFPFRLEKV